MPGQEIFAHKRREIPDNMKMVANEKNAEIIKQLGGTTDPNAHCANKPNPTDGLSSRT